MISCPRLTRLTRIVFGIQTGRGERTSKYVFVTRTHVAPGAPQCRGGDSDRYQDMRCCLSARNKHAIQGRKAIASTPKPGLKTHPAFLPACPKAPGCRAPRGSRHHHKQSVRDSRHDDGTIDNSCRWLQWPKTEREFKFIERPEELGCELSPFERADQG